MSDARCEIGEGHAVFRETLLEIVDNQLKDNDPPETREALDRLVSQGISEADAKLCIAQAVCVEVWDVLSNEKPFDQERFIKNLKRLPKEPRE
jgi:hypothetical protein